MVFAGKIVQNLLLFWGFGTIEIFGVKVQKQTTTSYLNQVCFRGLKISKFQSSSTRASNYHDWR